MEQYSITGMSCASCSSRVEKAVSGLEGITSCSVSMLTNTMAVEGSASSSEIIAAVEAAGYGASKKVTFGEKDNNTDYEEMLVDKATPDIAKRLIASVVLLAPLMFFAMGHMMGLSLPLYFEKNPLANGLIQLILSGLIMVINQKFFINGFRGLINRAPNMDTLVALGSTASYVYSITAVFEMADAYMRNDIAHAAHFLHELYFESAAMILVLITVGKLLESRSKGRTTDALKGLMRLNPKTAVVKRGDKEIEVPIEEVSVGDIFVVKPGENIPADGVVIEGSSAVNEASLTGESLPVDKSVDDSVSAATVNQSGYLVCRATRVGEDTALSRIIQMVSDAAATKAPIAKLADRVSGVFVPVVIILAIITTCVWLFVGKELGFALARGISVLVISCPCALGLATPVAIMVGNGMGARHGVMFKTAAALEETGKTEIAVLDKTGTITSGSPRVTDIIPVDGMSERDFMEKVYSLECMSEHPLSLAIVEYGNGMKLDRQVVTDFRAISGNGLIGSVNGVIISGGNAGFIGGMVSIPEQLIEMAGELAKCGKTPLYFSEDDKLLGIIAVADTIKPESHNAVSELKNMGIRVVMLTGDNKITATAIGKEVGVDLVVSEVFPDEKALVVEELKKAGKVAMVGDGINDAPALTTADIGIAIGTGTDIARDAADIILMKSKLTDVPLAIRLSRMTLKNIKENLFWAFIYNIVGIPLAMGVWIPVFGWTLNPMYGAAAMSLSSFCVVLNALRLNLKSISDATGDKKRKLCSMECIDIERFNKGGQKNMVTMNIEGMMCGHCEASVKRALEAIDGVAVATPSHEKNNAVIELSDEVSDEVLKAAVEAQDYKVVSIER